MLRIKCSQDDLDKIVFKHLDGLFTSIPTVVGITDLSEGQEKPNMKYRIRAESKEGGITIWSITDEEIPEDFEFFKTRELRYTHPIGNILHPIRECLKKYGQQAIKNYWAKNGI